MKQVRACKEHHEDKPGSIIKHNVRTLCHRIANQKIQKSSAISKVDPAGKRKVTKSTKLK